MTNTIYSALTCLTTLILGGCCCCGTPSFSPPTITDGFSDDSIDISTDDAATDDSTSGDGAANAGNTETEMADARQYAQQALSAKGYGNVKSVTLQKQGLDWYVTGSVAGLDGSDASYNVWFQVTKFENNNQVKTTWAVKTVTVDGEVVYP